MQRILCFLRSEGKEKHSQSIKFNLSVQLKNLILAEMLTDQMRIEGRIELSPVYKISLLSLYITAYMSEDKLYSILSLFTLKQDAVVIVLDVGPSMCQAAPGHSTSLEISVKAINMIIQRKVNIVVSATAWATHSWTSQNDKIWTKMHLP